MTNRGQELSSACRDRRPPFEDEPATRTRPRIGTDPDNVGGGLALLVLTVLNLLCELLERQAIRRVDGGALTAEQVQRLGVTFFRLWEEIDRLEQIFGATDDDLNLDRARCTLCASGLCSLS